LLAVEVEEDEALAAVFFALASAFGDGLNLRAPAVNELTEAHVCPPRPAVALWSIIVRHAIADSSSLAHLKSSSSDIALSKEACTHVLYNFIVLCCLVHWEKSCNLCAFV
jgi:hypothetical protein